MKVWKEQSNKESISSNIMQAPFTVVGNRRIVSAHPSTTDQSPTSNKLSRPNVYSATEQTWELVTYPSPTHPALALAKDADPPKGDPPETAWQCGTKHIVPGFFLVP